MPFSTFDPLSNKRTSQVLFQIMLGVDTPTRIAKKLQIEPPAVIDQLHKLRKVLVVRLGEKTGKEQHYGIDWDKLSEASVYRTIAPYYATGVFKATDATQFAKKFPMIQVFLKSYFQTVLSAYAKGEDYAKEGMQYHPTFCDWLDSLYLTLMSMMRNEEIFTEYLIDEPSLRSLSDSLRGWIDKSQQVVDPYAGTFLLNTLSNLGFKSKGAKDSQMRTHAFC